MLKLLAQGVDVAPMYWSILQHPELWNEHTARTEDVNSPHHELDDIWVRFGDSSNAIEGTPHDAKWYPSADVIVGVKELGKEIMRAFDGVELGGVLITRIPPGKECKRHKDLGWHARRYDKFAVQVTSAPGQKFCFDGLEIETKPGDLFWFDNQYDHWVTNPTPYERVTLIYCIRLDK